jgi:hypothetical protein
LAGTSLLPGVEADIADRLTRLGFTVQLERLRASPRTLVAVASAGAACGWVVLILAPFLVVDLPGWTVTITGLAALLFVMLLAIGIADGIVPQRWPEVEATNICAQRNDEPALWLVAHCDSKGQGVSLAGRVLAVTTLGVGLGMLVAGLVARIFTPLPWWAVAPAVLLTVIGGAALSRGVVSNDSPGAVDNATGVIAALVAAEQLRHRHDVGVLVTGAEEFAMAGARAWVAAKGPSGSFINFDGIDSAGGHRVMIHGSRRCGSADRSREIAEAVVGAMAGIGAEVVGGRLPPGVLVDGVALNRAGMPGVTVSRGSWQTLRVVHTRLDRPNRVDVGAAVLVGKAAAEAVETLLVDVV